MWCHASSLSVNTGYSFYRERGKHTNLYIRGLPRALNEVSGFIMGWLIVLQMPRSSFNNASLVGASRPVLPSQKINWNMHMVVVFPRCCCMWSTKCTSGDWVTMLHCFCCIINLQVCYASFQLNLTYIWYHIRSYHLIISNGEFYCHANNIASVKKLLLDWMLL